MKEIQNFQTSNYRTKVHDHIFVACFISKPNRLHIKKLSQLPTPYSVTQRLVDIVRIKYVCLRHASPHITGINATTSFSAASSKPKMTLRRNSKENSHNKHHLSRAETRSCTDRIWDIHRNPSVAQIYSHPRLIRRSTLITTWVMML